MASRTGPAPGPSHASAIRAVIVLDFLLAALFALSVLFAVLALYLVDVLETPGDLAGALKDLVTNPWGVLFALYLMANILLPLLAGLMLRKRRNVGRTLSMAAAILALSTVPLGTAMGIYSLVVLSRPGLKQCLTGRRTDRTR